jgi:hypothetical protein
VLTDVAVAVNPALVAPEGTVTALGTVTTALLLARLIDIPPPEAAPLSVTVQLSAPAPVSDELPQTNPLRTGAEGALGAPFPAFSCKAKVSVTPPAVAVSVAVCVVLTDATVAVNPRVEAPAGIDTSAGKVTAGSLL